MNPKEKIYHLLSLNISEVIDRDALTKILLSKKKLRVYLGVDPSGPIIHLGHAIALRKLREFQDLGHRIILLIGDFTGQIGDPTDRKALRQPLTRAEVLKNADTYQKQAAKILDFNGRNPAKIEFNSAWLKKIDFADLIKLAANFTVQQMLERDMFQKRIAAKKPIHLHEFFYPLMQGYDSVALRADVEIGGTDQKFNMLCGRTLREKMEGKVKHVITVPLLLGTDGRKMSKSYHNDIGITASPDEQYGKIMSMRDELILDYFKLCVSLEKKEINEIKNDLAAGENPRDLKARLAREIVTLYHDEKKALAAEREFEKVFQAKEKPSQIPELAVEEKSLTLLDLITKTKLVKSRGEIKRLAKEGAIRVADKKITDFNQKITISSGLIVQIGKRKFIKIKMAAA